MKIMTYNILKERNMTYENLAELVGITPSEMFNICEGLTGEIPFILLANISDELQVPIERLFQYNK